MRHGWMSFASHNKIHGACVVEIGDEELEEARERIAVRFPGREHDEKAVFVGACLYVSFRDGLNPAIGGETPCAVAVMEMPDEVWADMATAGVKPSRMLTPEQLAQFATQDDDDVAHLDDPGDATK